MKIVLRILKWFGITLGSIIVLLFLLNLSPWTFSKVKGENEFRRKDDYPLIVPHGGAKDLVPENTVYAFDMLINEYEVDVLEIDLTMTKDNILIGHHDLDLYNKELIRTLTYQEIVDIYRADNYKLAREFEDITVSSNDSLVKYPFSVGGIKDNTENIERMIPVVLEDIFTNVGNELLYMLEIKDNQTAIGYDETIHDYKLATATLVNLIRKYHLEEYVVIGSFDDNVINYMKEYAPEIKVGAGTGEATKFAIFSAFHIDFFWGVQSEVMILPNPESMKIPNNLTGLVGSLPGFIRNNIAISIDDTWHAYLMNKQTINDAHRKNIAVYYWTVNDPEEMRLLIKNGADGIITDRPDILIDIINEMKEGKK